jgi:hypothetical protein
MSNVTVGGIAARVISTPLEFLEDANGKGAARNDSGH